MGIRKKRPVYLSLLQLRFPVMAVASVLHRVSGLMLFLALLPLLYLFQLSLRSPDGYAQAAAWLDSGAGGLLLLLIVWALAHHTLAGLRALCLDLHCGVGLRAARWTARAVILGGVAAVLWAGVTL